MKKQYLFLVSLCFVSMLGYSQSVVLLDFETPATSTNFQYFGSVLEGELNNVVDNPDPTGLNTSLTVADFVHPSDGMPWAGAFANPALQGGVSTIAASTICMKVWFNEPGNVAVKLEDNIGAAPDWILQQDIDVVQEWTEVCFDLSANSIEAPNLPAVGNEYDGFVLFFDFNTVPDTDRSYFFDDVVVNYGGSATVNTTFTVDMSEALAAGVVVDTVFVRGTFNSWDKSNVAAPNGDGTYSATIEVPAGPAEFLYYVAAGDLWEEMRITDECVTTTFDADGTAFTNRFAVMTDGGEINTCWNSCYACDERASLTFNLGFAGNVTPEDEVYLAGGGNFDTPGGRFLMTDEDGDGVYSITIERGIGFSSFYTFANGNCPDFSCKESIVGQDCSDPDNFDDRFLEPLTGDTEVSTCFGECTTDTNCTELDLFTVNFAVDMSNEIVADEGVFFIGENTNWNEELMLDDDGDGVYNITFDLEGGSYEYLFKNGNGIVEIFNDGDPCTSTFDDGNGNIFINRIVEVNGIDNIPEAPCFNSCQECITSTNELEINNNLSTLTPSISSGIFQLEFLNGSVDHWRLVNTMGKEMEYVRSKDLSQTLDFQHLPKGAYYLYVQQKSDYQIHKLIIQ